MKFNRRYTCIIFLMVTLCFVNCSKSSEAKAELSVSPAQLSFVAEGETLKVTVASNAAWSISNIPAWLQATSVKGSSGSTDVQFTAASNATGATRTLVMEVVADNGQVRRLTVSQASLIYPSYNLSPKPSDATGMSSTAIQLSGKMKLGWNIVNTLEAPGGETAWGNPLVTRALIKLVKQNGFNAIRIPCAWDSHVDNKAIARIDPAWINRVKEVVQYCINEDLYVILNIHWDGGWLENNVSLPKRDSVNAKQKAFWEQIATAMRDFDEHLLFAGANEPNAKDAASTAILMSYHQTFINAVRATGGRNGYRNLIVQAPSTNNALAVRYFTSLPEDKVSNRLMVETHYYDPIQFTMYQDESWAAAWYYWGKNYHSATDIPRNATSGEEAYVDSVFNDVKKNFIDKGIPVVMGEFGAAAKDYLSGEALTLHNASRSHFCRYVTRQAKINGLVPFYWGNELFNRRDNTVADRQALDSLRIGAGL